MYQSESTSAHAFPFLGSLPLSKIFGPSLKHYYIQTKKSNALLRASLNIAESAALPLYRLSEPSLQRLDAFAYGSLEKTLNVARSTAVKAIQASAYPIAFAYDISASAVDKVEGTPVGGAIEMVYDVADGAIDCLVPACKYELEDYSVSPLIRKNPIRRLYRRVTSRILVNLPPNTLIFSEQLVTGYGRLALSKTFTLTSSAIVKFKDIVADTWLAGYIEIYEDQVSPVVDSTLLGMFDFTISQLRFWRDQAVAVDLRSVSALLANVLLLVNLAHNSFKESPAWGMLEDSADDNNHDEVELEFEGEEPHGQTEKPLLDKRFSQQRWVEAEAEAVLLNSDEEQEAEGEVSDCESDIEPAINKPPHVLDTDTDTDVDTVTDTHTSADEDTSNNVENGSEHESSVSQAEYDLNSGKSYTAELQEDPKPEDPKPEDPKPPTRSPTSPRLQHDNSFNGVTTSLILPHLSPRGLDLPFDVYSAVMENFYVNRAQRKFKSALESATSDAQPLE